VARFREEKRSHDAITKLADADISAGAHLRHLLNSYQKYYNEAHTHLSLHRTRRSRVPFRLSVARWRCQFWADCTTNISERKFPTGTAVTQSILDRQWIGTAALSGDCPDRCKLYVYSRNPAARNASDKEAASRS